VNLIQIGKIVINFEHVTDILPGDPAGPHPESLLLNLINGNHHTFTGDDAAALKAYIERTGKTLVKPLRDLEGH
jgi:hypothetical protein